MCHSFAFRPPLCTPVGEQTDLIIKIAKGLEIKHVEGLRPSLLNAEYRGELEFTYLGINQIKIHRNKKYNCFLRIGDKVLHFYVCDDLAQSVLFNK